MSSQISAPPAWMRAIEGIRSVIEPTRRVLEVARAAGVLVVYLTMQFNEDLANLGADDAPNRLRHLAMGVGQHVDAPDGTNSRVRVRDTWNTEIVNELAPQPSDVVVAKHRYSGFFETDLDDILRSRRITSLAFTDCTTSVCIESTLRDAFYRDYQCLLLTDCCAEAVGSDQARTNQDASLTVTEAPSVAPHGTIASSDFGNRPARSNGLRLARDDRCRRQPWRNGHQPTVR